MTYTEGLPPHLDESLAESKVDFYHNWLYSVVPATLDGKIDIFLAGYCRICGKAFSKQIETYSDGSYRETVMNVRKEGCIGPS